MDCSREVSRQGISSALGYVARPHVNLPLRSKQAFSSHLHAAETQGQPFHTPTAATATAMAPVQLNFSNMFPWKVNDRPVTAGGWGLRSDRWPG